MTTRWARTPLRVKLVAALVVLVTAALAAGGFAATASLRGYLVHQADTQLAQAAGQDHDDRFDGGPRGPDTRLPSQYVVAYCSGDGTVTRYDSSPLSGAAKPKLPRLTADAARARQGKPFTVGSVIGSTQWRVVPAATQTGFVLIARDLSDVQNTVRRLGFLEVVIGLIVVLLLSGIGYVMVLRSLAPLVAVETTAAAIAAGDLSRRVPQSDPRTEVGRLAAALSTMLYQVESAFRTREASEVAARESEERMRRFVADASHELRTPLTSIRGFAELYRQGAASSPEDVARAMRRIEDEGARMGLLVDDLLLLARLDQERPLESTPVDVATLAVDAVHDARAVDPDRPVGIEVRDAPLVVQGDESRLRQVLGNLVGNALAHTPSGTRVTVRATRRDDDAVVEVADDGPGLSPEDRERVFERFYRVDASRHRATGGGTGLGLSIVAALVAAHGGSVEVESEPGSGATFRVVLPLST